jgi:DNA segregation ATPase FtsK/SpoIIIE-like protein
MTPLLKRPLDAPISQGRFDQIELLYGGENALPAVRDLITLITWQTEKIASISAGFEKDTSAGQVEIVALRDLLLKCSDVCEEASTLIPLAATAQIYAHRAILARKVLGRTAADYAGKVAIEREELVALRMAADNQLACQGAEAGSPQNPKVAADESTTLSGTLENSPELHRPITLPTHPNDQAAEDLVPGAIKVLKATQRASISTIQRRLRVGYNRAFQIMELLEKKGIVGPEIGSTPREILVDLGSIETG